MDEIALASIWSEVLGVATVTAQANFFAELGGHSLAAVSVAAKVGERTGLPVEARDVYLAPTVRELAARLAALQSRLAELARSADPVRAVATALAEFGPLAAARFLSPEVRLAFIDAGLRQEQHVRGRRDALTVLHEIHGLGELAVDGSLLRTADGLVTVVCTGVSSDGLVTDLDLELRDVAR
jgi:acyl carrier protein